MFSRFKGTRMKTQKVLYAIRNKNTLEWVVFGSKVAWVSIGAAKNAFQLHMSHWSDTVNFDEQEDYKLVQVLGNVV